MINYLVNIRKANEDMVAAGYLMEIFPGHFEYTKAYYQSQQYLSSINDRSSSSSSSSSSGGGRSGGGGASSDW